MKRRAAQSLNSVQAPRKLFKDIIVEVILSLKKDFRKSKESW